MNDCAEIVCCPPDDFAYSAVDENRCPRGYSWNGTECVPPQVPTGDCTLTVIETEDPLDDGTVGEVYSETLSAIGGDSPYTWFLYSGTLPPGLTLNTSTGEISGTPTVAGNYTFVIKVTDAS